MKKLFSIILLSILSLPVAAQTRINLNQIQQQATNTIVGNTTAGTANLTAITVGSCSSAASALKWTTNTGIGCNTAIDAATVNGATLAVHTRQVFLTGTAQTYTTPANVRQLLIRIKGGGGGSGGSADATNNASAGGIGTATTFNAIGAAGGSGGAANTSTGAAPGIGGTGGAGVASVRIAGAPGGAPVTLLASATNYIIYGGHGGGNGGGRTQGASLAGIANSGGGASGAITPSTAFAGTSAIGAAAGGGEGEYAEIIITTPAASYIYTVGAGGTAGNAGTNGSAGAIGGSGYIIVDEYY